MGADQFKENYFENIDNNEKSYWLGFLYADGCVRKDRNAIVLGLCKKDEEIIDNFMNCLNINSNKKHNITRYLKTTNKYYQCVDLYVTSEKMKTDLCNYGCIPLKTTRLKLPFLNSDELYDAFLCGFYDGDGFEKAHKICCGCLDFLKEIKLKYNIPYKICLKKNPYGQCYELSIGWELRNRILKSYPNSLKRKRIFSNGPSRFKKGNSYNKLKTTLYSIDLNELNKIYLPINIEELKILVKTTGLNKIGKLYDVSESVIRRICKLNDIKLPSCKDRFVQNRKFEISKEELEKLIKEKSFVEIGKLYNVTDNSIRKRCKLLNIKIPKREPGYWAKKYALDNKNNDAKLIT